MNIRITTRVALLALVAMLSTAVSAQQKTTRIKEAIDIYVDVLRQLDINYVDTIDYESVNEDAINYLLYQLDPYTSYYSSKDEDQFKYLRTGKYSGIGSRLLTIDSATYIEEVFDAMPADKAGVRAGDKIVAIDGKSVKGQNASEINKQLRGVAGTTFKLTVERLGEKKPLTFSVTRDEIKMPTVPLAITIPTDKGKVGYLVFSEFTLGSAEEFAQALYKLRNEGMESLVIDLRGNGGGIVEEAVKILGHFLPQSSTVAQTKGKDVKRNKTYRTHTAPDFEDLPLTILVDNNTASASEIVAGALQDLDRATLIGSHTFGKGLVQSTRSIEHGGNLKVTTAKYYLPSGRCIQAFDYSKRREDGNIRRVPDSLTHEFRTAKGRIVRDGGGIKPDIEVEDTITRFSICYSLYQQNMFFRFSNVYHAAHLKVAPAAEFEVDQAIIDEFEAFLKEQGFSYDSETAKCYRLLLQCAEIDDIAPETLEKIKELEKAMGNDLNGALRRQNYDIRQLLGAALMQHYYKEYGRSIYMLKFDRVLKKALNKE